MKFIVVETERAVYLLAVDNIIGTNVTESNMTCTICGEHTVIEDIINMDEIVEDLLNLRG